MWQCARSCDAECLKATLVIVTKEHWNSTVEVGINAWSHKYFIYFLVLLFYKSLNIKIHFYEQ